MKIEVAKIIKGIVKANEAIKIVKVLPGPIVVGTAIGAVVGTIALLAKRKV